MEQVPASLRADIKRYEDTLAKEPGSYCFAPLAELYRKVGLLDDAITVARRGCGLHPDYVGGYMALGRACFEKGMKEEGRGALEKVVAMTPDNLLAHKLLSRIYLEQGETAAAGRALRLILSQSPGDMESRALLDSLEDSSPESEYEFALDQGAEGDEIILEDAEIVEELTDDDLVDEDEFIVSPARMESPIGDPATFDGERNPLSTATLAELYISQGFLKRALTIYRELLETEPDNAALKKRLFELKKVIDEDEAIARNEVLAGEETPEAGVSGDAEAGMAVSSGGESRVVETLEHWLANIRRRR